MLSYNGGNGTMKALAIAAAVAATTAAVTAVRADAPEARPAASPCKPQLAHGPSVGKLERTSGRVFQGKNALKEDGAKLFTNATLCTLDGRATFLVTPLKRTSCEMRPEARLRLYPPKLKKAHRQVVIRFEEGKTYCGTGKEAEDREEKYDARKGQVRLLMKDPLFAAEVDPSRTLIQVELGYLEVSRRLGEGPVIVGAGQRVTVPELALPGKVGAIDKTSDDQAAFDALRPRTPKPDFSPPNAAGSATLKQIFSRKSIIVGVDSAGNKERTEFTRLFFAFLAKSWGVSLVLREASTTSLVAQLRRDLDVAVTSEVTQLTPFDRLPFFAAPQVWYLGVVPDEVFVASLGRFVRAAVSGGAYRVFYRGAFEREPPLDPLAPVLFP
jgi:hypothetical protein